MDGAGLRPEVAANQFATIGLVAVTAPVVVMGE
jgi:hypothetical protein